MLIAGGIFILSKKKSAKIRKNRMIICKTRITPVYADKAPQTDPDAAIGLRGFLRVGFDGALQIQAEMPETARRYALFAVEKDKNLLIICSSRETRKGINRCVF